MGVVGEGEHFDHGVQDHHDPESGARPENTAEQNSLPPSEGVNDDDGGPRRPQGGPSYLSRRSFTALTSVENSISMTVFFFRSSQIITEATGQRFTSKRAEQQTSAPLSADRKNPASFFFYCTPKTSSLKVFQLKISFSLI